MRLIIYMLTTLTVWSLTANIAKADLPDDRYVDYYIRESPTHPESDIQYIIRLELSAAAQDGDTIAWEILSTTYVEVGTGGSGDKVWTDDSPLPATSNGYWNITHDNPEEPQNEEFDWVPVLVGTATAVDPEDDDLDYDLSGDDCDPAYAQYYGGYVTAITFAIWLPDSHQPEAAGDDEPIEIKGGHL
jgi:hypothetical protein